MLADDLQSLAEFLLGRYKAELDHLLLLMVLLPLGLLILSLLYQEIKDKIQQRNQSAEVRSNEIVLILALNKLESYMAEGYCTLCHSSAVFRCINCDAVAYCSKRCQIDHWEHGHWEECYLLGNSKTISRDMLNKCLSGLIYRVKYVAEINCADCDTWPKTELCLWPEYDIFRCQGREMDHSVVDDGKSTNEASDQFELFALNPEIQLLASHSLSKGCSTNCKLVIYCPEHHQSYELGDDHRQEPQLGYGGDDECTRQLTHFPATKLRAEYGVTKYRYPTFERSSSSDSCSTDASESDAISSLHSLE